MKQANTLSRRGFLSAVAALSSAGLAACAANSQPASGLTAADRRAGMLPQRRHFVVRHAYVVTMDAKLGDLPDADVHVRDGALVAVGPNLAAPGAEEIDGRNRIALPGFVDTHFHLWGSFARGVVADGDFDYFPVMSRLGPVMTPEDAYNSAKLGIAEAINSGLTTIHDWSHNIINGAHADADLRALRDCAIRARFSYGYSRNLQLKPKETADFNDIARVKREWFGASNVGRVKLFVSDQTFVNIGYRYEWFVNSFEAASDNRTHGNHVANIGLGFVWGGSGDRTQQTCENTYSILILDIAVGAIARRIVVGSMPHLSAKNATLPRSI